MTFRECLSKKGVIADVDLSSPYGGTYEVQFVNPDGADDHVTFDIDDIGTKSGNEKCEALYKDFYIPSFLQKFVSTCG